jgi:hypothetical protein
MDSITLAILPFSLAKLAIRIFLIYPRPTKDSIISLNISGYELDIGDSAFARRISDLCLDYVLAIHHNRMAIRSLRTYRRRVGPKTLFNSHEL